jgi:hypothetical protein
MVTADEVTITTEGGRTQYRFPWIRRQGLRRNGMGAMLFGAIPCVLVGVGMPLCLEWFLGDRLYDGPPDWFMHGFLWFWRVCGVFFGLLFAGVTAVSILKGGTARLSLGGTTLWVSSFHGGELQLYPISRASIRQITVEKSEAESDVIERGHIRITVQGEEDVLAAQGYPMAMLDSVSTDLRQRLEIAG